jgi:hypothetical protein
MIDEFMENKKLPLLNRDTIPTPGRGGGRTSRKASVMTVGVRPTPELDLNSTSPQRFLQGPPDSHASAIWFQLRTCTELSCEWIHQPPHQIRDQQKGKTSNCIAKNWMKKKINLSQDE